MADSKTEDDLADPHIVVRSLIWGTVVSVLAVFALNLLGHAKWSLAFGVGASLSLFSLFSLGMLVPKLTSTKSPGGSQFLLALLLFLKLPMYTIVLYALTRACGDDVKFAFPGVLVAPVVIGARTIWAVIFHLLRSSRVPGEDAGAARI